MSTRSDPSKEGLDVSHISDTERSKWFWWRWKRSNDIWFRVAVMKEWSIMYGSGWDTGDFSGWLLLNMSATLMWWIGSIYPKCGWYGETMVMWPVNETTQPDSGTEWKCHVQERLATNKGSLSFFPIFPQSLLTSTSLFLSSLRRITYACSIIFPSGKPIAMF